MLKTLSYKRGLYYAPDQDLGNKKSAINVPFFDVEEVATTKGTYMLYRKYRDLTLVPCILLESKDPNYIYEFKILEPLTFAEDATEREVVSQTNKKIEEMVYMDIDNYLWLHRRFKNSPGCEHLYDSIKIEHSYEKRIRRERERHQRHQEQQAQQAQQSQQTQQTKDTEQVEPNKNPDHSGKN